MSSVTLEPETVGPPDYCKSLGYPPALSKACSDEFFYAMLLSTGSHLEFVRAEAIDARWVRIFGGDDSKWPRGLEVRTDAIISVLDAPDGS